MPECMLYYPRCAFCVSLRVLACACVRLRALACACAPVNCRAVLWFALLRIFRHFFIGPAPQRLFRPPPSSSFGKMSSRIALAHIFVAGFRNDSPRRSS